MGIVPYCIKYPKGKNGSSVVAAKKNLLPVELESIHAQALKIRCDISPAEPLWKRVPLHNDDGKQLSDFMMIIPRLKHQPLPVIKEVVDRIERVLRCYDKQVVFADLNINLNVLWVSVQPIAGICLEVAAAIHHHVPEAKLVASKIY